MFSNYLKTAWRNFLRNRTFSLIKIAGLSIGLTVCMLIFLYTKDELSYDRFHDKQAHLYRIVQDFHAGTDDPRKLGVTTPQLGPAFESAIPEIVQYVRTNTTGVTIRNKNDVFSEFPLFADSTFFSVFSFPLLKGNPATVLNDVNTVVLSEDMAKKYFGSTDVIGKTIELKMNSEFDVLLVSGVAKNCPQNSTIRFDVLLPLSYYNKYNKPDEDWIGGNVNTFVLLNPRAQAKTVERKMQSLYTDHIKEQVAAVKKKGIVLKIDLGLEPIRNIHLGTFGQDNGLVTGSSITYSWVLSSIAIFILVVACINFITLAVAQSLKRSKEIGVRKVMGSNRGQLIRQFLTESLVLAAISFVVAILLTYLVLPFFNELANKKLSLSYLGDYQLYLGYFALLLVTSFITGFYPSLVLSSFKPVQVLYNRYKLAGKNYFTRALVVLQFTLAIFLIIGTIAIYTQLNFMQHKDLGYDAENLVRIDMPSGKSNSSYFQTFSHELAGNPSVVNMAGKNRGANITGVRTEGKDIEIDYSKISENYLPVLKIPVKEGRNFDSRFPSDATQSAIVNESFVHEAGWQQAVGRTVTFRSNDKTFTIVGVVKDYHFRSLKTKIAPQLFTLDTSGNYGQAWIKINAADIPGTITSLQQAYKKISPFSPFSYQFISDIMAKSYEEEARWKQIISVASILFIFISCIGLLGLVMLFIEQRTKEIGIRKVLGAAVVRVVLLVAKDFMLLAGIAFLIAIPAGYYAVDKWLQNFAYRINISWWMFGLGGALVLLCILLTICSRAFKAAWTNPVKSLRGE